MKYFTIALVTMMTSPAFASDPILQVPEMDAGAGLAAIALLAGIAAIVREKSKRR